MQCSAFPHRLVRARRFPISFLQSLILKVIHHEEVHDNCHSGGRGRCADDVY